MVIVEANGKRYYMEARLKYNLDKGVAHMKQNDDFPILIAGVERAGKSELRDQIAAYLGTQLKTKFGIDNIHFVYTDYMKESLNTPKYSIHSHDEARRDLNKLRQMSKSNVEYNNFLSEVGDKNQVHIIILPSANDIDPYVGLHRAKLIIVVHKYDDPKDRFKVVRGIYTVFNMKRRKELKEYMYSKYDKYPKSLIHFRGKFGKVGIIPEKDYLDKKAKYRDEKYAGEEDKIEIKLKNVLKQRDNCIAELKRNKTTRRRITELTGLSDTTIGNIPH